MQIPKVDESFRSMEELHTYITKYKQSILSQSDTLTEYSQGFYNSLELVESLVEGRPYFHISKNKTHCAGDIKAFPEYFL